MAVLCFKKSRVAQCGTEPTALLLSTADFGDRPSQAVASRLKAPRPTSRPAEQRSQAHVRPGDGTEWCTARTMARLVQPLRCVNVHMHASARLRTAALLLERLAVLAQRAAGCRARARSSEQDSAPRCGSWKSTAGRQSGRWILSRQRPYWIARAFTRR